MERPNDVIGFGIYGVLNESLVHINPLQGRETQEILLEEKIRWREAVAARSKYPIKLTKEYKNLDPKLSRIIERIKLYKQNNMSQADSKFHCDKVELVINQQS